ncbi:hypothetical protein GQ43DRAFT_54091 [Delitschia confertaspora ATCC 74209]|uniref:Uncharacterized protein n=1 Tax=Delitschia confertaspora ATCC 74209 TaxID=1513339 RepID=A0A9P4MSG0_9PLEO|nr:hypothetical protein GQ43DRAFT_54091 [Delitschia confertaspora ATCC 74209]
MKRKKQQALDPGLGSPPVSSLSPTTVSKHNSPRKHPLAAFNTMQSSGSSSVTRTTRLQRSFTLGPDSVKAGLAPGESRLTLQSHEGHQWRWRPRQSGTAVPASASPRSSGSLLSYVHVCPSSLPSCFFPHLFFLSFLCRIYKRVVRVDRNLHGPAPPAEGACWAWRFHPVANSSATALNFPPPPPQMRPK